MLVKETPVALRDDYAEVAQRAMRRRRRRIVTWSLFGLVGLALGAVWAAGVVTTNSTVGGATASPPLLVTPGAAGLDSRFAGVLTPESTLPLNITFSGKKGVVATDAQMFEVDLTLDDPSTPAADEFSGTYFVTVELTNDVSGTGWGQLDLEFSAAVGACGGVDDDPNMATAPIKSVLHVETSDSTVDLAGLSGGETYCIGVNGLGDASDADGTFIRKTTGGSTPTQPTFAAYMAQSAT
jgi:hypothetical protein